MNITMKIISVLVVLSLVLGFAACGQKKPETPVDAVDVEKEDPAPEKEPEPKAVEEDPDPEPEPEEKPKVSADNKTTEMSDDLFDFTFKINGSVYSLPADLSIMKEEGFEFVRSDIVKSTTINPNQIAFSEEMIDDRGVRVSVKMGNLLSKDTIPMEQGIITAFSVDTEYQNNNILELKLELAKGITLDSTMEDVVKAYGEPAYISDLDTSLIYEYQLNTYDTVKFRSGDGAKLKITDIEITNTNTEGMAITESSVDLTDVKASDTVKSYSAPSAVGDSLDTYNMEIEGDLYHLPAPIQSFLDNGWKIQDSRGDTLGAKSAMVGVILSKGTTTIKVQTRNYEESEQALANTFITVIQNNAGGLFNFQLPKGINKASTKDEIISAYGEPKPVDDSASFEYLVYGTIREGYEFSVEKETGEIFSVQFDHSPKTPTA